MKFERSEDTERREERKKKMRLSNQLGVQSNCPHNTKANISVANDVITTAAVQKAVIKRALMGEDLDYESELSILFDKEGVVFENQTLRNAQISLMAKRIDRLVNYERYTPSRAHKIFRRDMNGGEPVVVDYFGEQVEALPDYAIEYDDMVVVCKIKTGKGNFTRTENVESQEAYCLGKAGELIADGRDVYVQYLYLADPERSAEVDSLVKISPTEYAEPYDTTARTKKKIFDAKFDDSLKEAIATHLGKIKEEMEANGGCKIEDCASCPEFNICHYEEPPIAHTVEEVVHRDWDQIESMLSYDQRQVINYDRGISRVNAGPGSGKTLVTSMRVSKLVENGCPPEAICLLTFTKAGAGEMTARSIDYGAHNNLAIDPDTLTSTTFNSFCQHIIEDHYEELGYARKPRVVPDEVKRGIINRIIDQFPKISQWSYSSSAKTKVFNTAVTKVPFAAAIRDFELIKKEGYTRDTLPDDFNRGRRYTDRDLDVLFLMYEEFNKQLKERCLLEYDDQIREVERLLTIRPSLFNEMGYQHIIVDEFQDTDLPQINLLQKMIDTTCFKSFMCVGDDSQSIFAFRHTSPEYMINFQNYFGNFDSFNLVENHRSPRALINYANSINDMAEFKVNKELTPTKDGNAPTIQGYYTKNQEYQAIANNVAERWEAGERDIAVIASDRLELSAIADKLTQLGVPSSFKSPVFLNQNSRIRALMTFYDSFSGKSTQGFLDYKNIIMHGEIRRLGKEEREQIIEEFKNDLSGCEKTVSAFVEFAKALDLSENDECYQDFLDKVKECRDYSELKEFMEDFKIYGQESKYTNTGTYDGVTLTTVHSSKGLEWDTTYLVMDKLYKKEFTTSPLASRQNGTYDEAVRKWFVGATRAKENLILCGQYLCGQDIKNQVSYFNKFLQESYRLLGKVWDYSFVEGERIRAEEKAAEMGSQESARERGISENVARVLANITSEAPGRER